MICPRCGGVIAHYYGCPALTITLPAQVWATPLVSRTGQVILYTGT